MATIYNSELSKEIIEGANIAIARDRIPIELAEKVVPVMEVNPKLLKRCNYSGASLGTAGTILTAALDRDTFITGGCLSICKIAADTGTNAQLRITSNGVSFNILLIAGVTLTANNATVAVNLNPPIKADRGTAITTIGANISVVGGSIWGYTEVDK
jgi:hypothetical protein